MYRSERNVVHRLSWDNWIHSTTSHFLIFLKSILIHSSHKLMPRPPKRSLHLRFPDQNFMLISILPSQEYRLWTLWHRLGRFSLMSLSLCPHLIYARFFSLQVRSPASSFFALWVLHCWLHSKGLWGRFFSLPQLLCWLFSNDVYAISTTFW
jgi:hypothetical protein